MCLLLKQHERREEKNCIRISSIPMPWPPGKVLEWNGFLYKRPTFLKDETFSLKPTYVISICTLYLPLSVTSGLQMAVIVMGFPLRPHNRYITNFNGFLESQVEMVKIFRILNFYCIY